MIDFRRLLIVFIGSCIGGTAFALPFISDLRFVQLWIGFGTYVFALMAGVSLGLDVRRLRKFNSLRTLEIAGVVAMAFGSAIAFAMIGKCFVGTIGGRDAALLFVATFCLGVFALALLKD